MSLRLGINGFGRMGRLAMRAGWGVDGLEFAHVNEVKGGAATAAHLLEFDSVHGRWDRPVTHRDDAIVIDNHAIGFGEAASPGDIDWQAHGVDVVLECSGKFLRTDILQAHLDRGARKVVVAAPVKTKGALNLVYGVNDGLYDPEINHIVTAASCTTNCLAPVVKVIHENIRIARGSITTIHDVTNTQTMVDAPHKDLRRARSGLTSMIPTTTGSATAITIIYPDLKGRLNGHAVRVPLLNASLTDCVFDLERETTVEEVNGLFQAAAEGPLKGVLGFETRPLVSADYLNDPRSSIVDGPSTMVVDGRHLKVYAWYDNEWGYVNRMIDIVRKIGASL